MNSRFCDFAPWWIPCFVHLHFVTVVQSNFAVVLILYCVLIHQFSSEPAFLRSPRNNFGLTPHLSFIWLSNINSSHNWIKKEISMFFQLFWRILEVRVTTCFHLNATCVSTFQRMKLFRFYVRNTCNKRYYEFKANIIEFKVTKCVSFGNVYC